MKPMNSMAVSLLHYKCLINKSYSIFVNLIISPLLSVKIIQGVVSSALLSDFNLQWLHRAQMMQSASTKQCEDSSSARRSPAASKGSITPLNGPRTPTNVMTACWAERRLKPRWAAATMRGTIGWNKPGNHSSQVKGHPWDDSTSQRRAWVGGVEWEVPDPSTHAWEEIPQGQGGCYSHGSLVHQQILIMPF